MTYYACAVLLLTIKFDTNGQRRHLCVELAIIFDDLVYRILGHTRQCYFNVLDPFFRALCSSKRIRTSPCEQSMYFI